MPFFLFLKNMKKNQRVYGRRKNTIEKKGPFQIFAGSPEFGVDPADWLVYSGSIASSNFEWNKPTPKLLGLACYQDPSVGFCSEHDPSCCIPVRKGSTYVGSLWQKDPIRRWVMVNGRQGPLLLNPSYWVVVCGRQGPTLLGPTS